MSTNSERITMFSKSKLIYVTDSHYKLKILINIDQIIRIDYNKSMSRSQITMSDGDIINVEETLKEIYDISD